MHQATLRGPEIEEGCGHTMIFVGSSLTIRIPMTFLSDNMDEPRTTGRSRFHILQNGDKVFNVVAIHRTNVIQPKLLKHCGTRSTDHPPCKLIYF